MAVNDSFHASCRYCGWAYVGNQAEEKYEQHMKEHDTESFSGWLTLNDRELLKRMGISPE